MESVFAYNRGAWDREVESGNCWTVPVTAEQIESARKGEWSVLLTECKPMPRNWVPADLHGVDLLCPASGGGQLRTGFHLVDLYEDYEKNEPLKDFMPAYMATRAIKPISA